MEYTEEQIIKYRQEFKKRRSRRIIIFWFALVFLLVIGFIVMPIMDKLGVPRLTWAPFVYLIMFGIIALIAFVWRCPACNGLLGDVFTTRYCSKCGFKFTRDER
jgi:hypothetical protein